MLCSKASRFLGCEKVGDYYSLMNGWISLWVSRSTFENMGSKTGQQWVLHWHAYRKSMLGSNVQDISA